jgi:hypothetical protein
MMDETGEDRTEYTITLPTPHEVKERVEFLKDLHIDLTAIKKKFPRYKKEHSTDPSKAKRTWDSISTDLERSLESWKREKLGLQLDMLADGIVVLDAKGIESVGFRSDIEKVRGDLSTGDLSDLESRIADMREVLGAHLHRFNDVLLLQAIYSFDRGVTSYIDSARNRSVNKDSKKYFKRVWESAKKRDVSDLLIYSNLLHNTAQSDVTEVLAKDKLKDLKDKFDRIKDRLQDYQEFGIDPEPIRKELSRLDSTMEAKGHIDLEGSLNNLDKSMARLESEYLRRKGEVGLVEAKMLLDSYGNLLDLGSFRERYAKLRDDEGKMSPHRFLDESSSLLQGLKENLFSNFNDQVNQRLSNLDNFLSQATPGAESIVVPIMELRDRSRSYLLSGDITESMEYLALAESMMGHAEGELRLQELREGYSNLLVDFQHLLDENVDVAEVRDLIGDIEGMFLQDEIRPNLIMENIGKGEFLIKDKVTQVRRSSFQKERESLMQTLSEIETEDPRKREVMDLMDSLESSMEEMDEEGYAEHRMGIRTVMDNLLTDHFRSNFPGMEEALASSIRRLTEKGADISVLAESLETAKEDFQNGRYLESGKALKTIESDLTTMERDFKQRTAEDRINSAEFLFEEAKRSGVDVDDVTGSIQEAKRLLADGMFSEAADIADRVESSVKGRWMEMRKNRLFGEILTLKDLAGDTQSIGLEFDGIRDLINETESLFQDGNYEEANELVQKARDGLDSSRKQFFSESAMGAITSVKDEIKEASAIGVSTLEAETLLMEAERYFLNEDYEEAYKVTLDIRQKLTDARSHHLSEEIPRRMGDINKKVERLEAMGLDTTEARDLIDRSTLHMAEGKYDESLAEMGGSKDLVDELFRSHVSVTIPESIVEIRKEIDQAMGLGIGIDDISELLETAEEMFVKEDYEKALSRIGEVQQTLTRKRGDFLRDRFLTEIESVENLMDSTDGLDREVVLSKENMNMARDAFERGDYESSHALLERITHYIKDSISDKEAGKQKNAVLSQYDEVKLLIEVARSENVDINAETNIMKMALDLVENGDLSQAEQVIQGVKRGVQDKRIEMKRDLIESSVQTTEIILLNMKELGMDVSVELSLMADLKEALRRNDLDLCDSLNRKLEENLKKNRTPFTVQKVQKDITALRGRVLEAEGLGLDIRQAKSCVSESQAKYDEGNLDAAQSVLKQGNEVLDAAFTQHRRVEIEKLFTELDERIKVMDGSGIPYDDELMLKEKSRQLFADGDLEEASMWLNTAILGANAKITSFQRTSAEGWISQIKDYLISLKEMGLSISDLEKIFSDGIALHEGGQDDKAIGKFSSILDLGEDKRKNQQESYLAGIFQRLDRWYKDLVPLGLKPSGELAGLHERLTKAFEKGGFDPNRTEEELTRSRILLETESSKYMSDLSKKHIEDATKAFKDLKDRGITDDDILERTREAGRKWRNNDFIAADEAAMDALDRIERLSLAESEEGVKAEMASVRQMLTRLKSIGSNVENAENLYSRAELAIKDGKAKAAKKIIDSIRETIKEIVDRNLRESARESIDFTEAMINYLTDNFSGISVKLAPANEVLGKAKAVYQDKDYKGARSHANQSREMVEKVDHTNINQFLYVFRSSQATEFAADINNRMAELAKKGIDMSKAKAMMDQAQKYFDSDEFEKGRELIILDRILLGELESQSLKEQSTSLINEAHVSILNAGKQGIDISAAMKIYNNAKEAFALKEYKKALLLAKKVSFQLKR